MPTNVQELQEFVEQIVGPACEAADKRIMHRLTNRIAENRDEMIGNLQNQCEAVRRGASLQVEEAARRSMELVEQKMKKQRDELLTRLPTIAAQCTPVDQSPGCAQPLGPDREPSASPDVDMPVMPPMPRSEIPRTVIGGPIMGRGEADNSIGFAERLRHAEGSFGGAPAERTWRAGGGSGGPVRPEIEAAGMGRPGQMGIHARPFVPEFPGGIRPTPSDPNRSGTTSRHCRERHCGKSPRRHREHRRRSDSHHHGGRQPSFAKVNNSVDLDKGCRRLHMRHP